MDDLKIYEITFDDDNYMHFNIDVDGYKLDGLFRVLDPANGVSMELVSIDNGDRHSIILEQWENIEQQCKLAATEKYNELIRVAQFKVISEFNPAPNEYQTWIRKAEDIKTFNDTLKDNDWEGWEINGFDDSYSAFDVENALKSGKIKVYSSHPIKQGIFVTPSYMEAYSYSGDGKVYSTVVDLDDVAWIDPTQGQYAPVKHIKSMYSGEVEVYFDGDNVSITDKYNRHIKLQPADNYSYNSFEEYLNGISKIYPEYRLFIENNTAKLISDYNNALQAVSAETKSVRLAQLEADMYEGGGYGEDNANLRAETEISRLNEELEKSASSLEPLPKSKPQHNIKFIWNGIKIDGQLYKGNYYSGTYIDTSKLPEGTITIHMDRSNTPRIESLEIENNSDSMTDYFETDTVRIKPDSIYYASAVTAANAYEIHMEKVAIKQYEKSFAKHLGTDMEEYYANEILKHKAKLFELEKKSSKDKSVRKKTVPQW